MLRIAARERLASTALKVSVLLLGAAAVMLPNQGSANDFCPNIYKGGSFELPFNPAFTHIDTFNAPNGSSYDGLIVTSFFNAIKNPDPNANSVTSFYERDLVARIPGIGYRSSAWWNPSQAEILTDLDLANPVTPNALGQQVWPNEAQRVPDGILPFEAIVSPQGFHPTPSSGRLTLINLDDPNYTEYLIDQSTQNGGPCKFDPSHPKYDPDMQPRFLITW